MLSTSEYQAWQAFACRCSRRANEGADLLHDALVIAISGGRADLSDSANCAWLRGVIRKLAAMDARSAVRRKRREVQTARSRRQKVQGDASEPPGERWLASLPKSARVVVTLALHGMTPAEIRHVLRLTDTAFRQRLTSIRRTLRQIPGAGAEVPARPGVPLLDVGLLRQALLPVVRRRGVLGSHDPDGHLILFDRKNSQTRPPRQRPGGT